MRVVMGAQCALQHGDRVELGQVSHGACAASLCMHVCVYMRMYVYMYECATYMIPEVRSSEELEIAASGSIRHTCLDHVSTYARMSAYGICSVLSFVCILAHSKHSIHASTHTRAFKHACMTMTSAQTHAVKVCDVASVTSPRASRSPTNKSPLRSPASPLLMPSKLPRPYA
jgi:hypothetical protein